MAKNSYVKGGYYYRREKGGSKFLRIRPQREPKSTGGAGTPAANDTASQDTIGSLLTPMSPAQINSLAKSLVESEFTPRRAALSQARGQINSDLKFQSGLNKDLTANTDKVYEALPGQIKTAGDTATKAIDKAAGQMKTAADARNAAYQKAMQGDVRGQGLDGGYQGALEIQQKELAASNEANRAAAIGGSATNTQASQDLAAQMRGVAQTRAQEMQQELNRKSTERLSANDLALAQLAQDESGKQSSLVEQMRKDEFTKAATIAGLDLKQQIALMENATKRYGIDTTAATTRRGQDVTARGQTLQFVLGNRKVNATLSEGEKNRTNAYNIALIRAAGKGKSTKSILGSMTPAQLAKLRTSNEKTRGAIEEASNSAKQIRAALEQSSKEQKAAGKSGFKVTSDMVIQQIAKQYKLDPKAARAAYEMRNGGSLSKETAAALKRMLITIPSRWRAVGSRGAGTYDKPMG